MFGLGNGLALGKGGRAGFGIGWRFGLLPDDVPEALYQNFIFGPDLHDGLCLFDQNGEQGNGQLFFGGESPGTFLQDCDDQWFEHSPVILIEFQAADILLVLLFDNLDELFVLVEIIVFFDFDKEATANGNDIVGRTHKYFGHHFSLLGRYFNAWLLLLGHLCMALGYVPLNNGLIQWGICRIKGLRFGN